MDTLEVMAYYEAITVIEARSLLIQLMVADYPHMKTERKQEVHRDVHRQAYPKTYEKTEVLTTQQIAERFNRILHGK